MVLTEGVMGLFDGANLPGRPDAGSTADLAALSGWPVILVINAAKQAASVAALAAGFARHRADVCVAGVIFNRVGSPAHEQVLCDAMALTCPEIAVLGAVPRHSALALPERHLGLVQAGEQAGRDDFIEGAAGLLSRLSTWMPDRVVKTLPVACDGHSSNRTDTTPGQRVAIARDDAFTLPIRLCWKTGTQRGQNCLSFHRCATRPLTRRPTRSLSARRLPRAACRETGVCRDLSDRTAQRCRAWGRRVWRVRRLYGSRAGAGGCHRDTSPDGRAAALETSFAQRKLNLGYRTARTLSDTRLGRAGTTYRGHEFHYATVISEDNASPLFAAANARAMTLALPVCRSAACPGPLSI